MIMTKEEVIHLSNLSRIALSDEEIDRFRGEIESILEYVSTVQHMVEKSVGLQHTGMHSNIFRKDEVLHVPGEATEDLLSVAPRRQDNFLVVNKILQQDE
jgi:aspartyl-tRNA(Asn)/glutamyl-tRNA(Gln) amidotransferase subunit C